MGIFLNQNEKSRYEKSRWEITLGEGLLYVIISMWSGWINKIVYGFEKKIQTYLLFCPHYVLNHSDLQNQLVIVTGMLVINGQFIFVKSYCQKKQKYSIRNSGKPYPFTEIFTWVNTWYHKLPAISNTKINIMKRASYFNIIYSYTTVISLNLASDLYIQ